jgi:hypothetical protein
VRRFQAVPWLLFCACDPSVGFETEPDIDTGMVGDADVDTDADSDSDVDEDDDLVVTYALTAYDGAVTCEGGWLNTLHLVAEGPADPIEADFPCDDAPIRLSDLTVGRWTVSLRGEMSSGAFFEGSGSADVEGETELTIDMPCDDNGLDDGCGGG